MTRADIVDEVAENTDLTKEEAEVLVEAFLECLADALKSGESVELRGFGSFRFRERNPRLGRNPKTGAPVEVPAKRILYFKPAKALRKLINS